MDRELFYIPECFWINKYERIEKCDCKKIFFDVQIDFIDYRLIICKDWYINEFKSLKEGIKPNCNTKNVFFLNNDTKSIQEMIIYYLINKYFQTPILDYLGVDKKISYSNQLGTVLGRAYTLRTVNYTFCERPLIFKKVNLLKFIEFYIYEYMPKRDIYDSSKNNINEMWNESVLVLYELSNEATAGRYNKIRPLIKKMYFSHYNQDKGSILNDIVIELLLQFKKLKIKTL